LCLLADEQLVVEHAIFTTNCTKVGKTKTCQVSLVLASEIGAYMDCRNRDWYATRQKYLLSLERRPRGIAVGI
jgi:hypothetical protein